MEMRLGCCCVGKSISAFDSLVDLVPAPLMDDPIGEPINGSAWTYYGYQGYNGTNATYGYKSTIPMGGGWTPALRYTWEAQTTDWNAVNTHWYFPHTSGFWLQHGTIDPNCEAQPKKILGATLTAGGAFRESFTGNTSAAAIGKYKVYESGTAISSVIDGAGVSQEDITPINFTDYPSRRFFDIDVWFNVPSTPMGGEVYVNCGYGAPRLNINYEFQPGTGLTQLGRDCKVTHDGTDYYMPISTVTQRAIDGDPAHYFLRQFHPPGTAQMPYATGLGAGVINYGGTTYGTIGTWDTSGPQVWHHPAKSRFASGSGSLYPPTVFDTVTVEAL